MKLVGLTVYGINVRNEAHRNLELHDVYGVALIDYLQGIANAGMGAYDRDASLENVFTYDRVNRQTIRNEAGQPVYDILYLRVKTGEYGEESEIVDSETGETTYNKSVEEADVMPFGCCIIVPVGQYTEGIVLVQSLGRNGITSTMKKRFNEYIRLIDSQLRVTMNPIIPRQYMERILNEGVLKKVRLISYGIPDDEADRYGIDRGTTKIVRERVLRSPIGFVRNKYDVIMQCVRGERNFNSIIELDDFEINDFKMEFAFGRRNKTISMKELESLVINEDITDYVEKENGHPVFQSLCEVMRETGEDYLRVKGFIE